MSSSDESTPTSEADLADKLRPILLRRADTIAKLATAAFADDRATGIALIVAGAAMLTRHGTTAATFRTIVESIAQEIEAG